MTVFRSTPLREGRPGDADLDALVELVSIHAPAGGATVKDCDRSEKQAVSIHAPAGGATNVSAI